MHFLAVGTARFRSRSGVGGGPADPMIDWAYSTSQQAPSSRSTASHDIRRPNATTAA